jgi:hypothetical protein
MRTFFAQVETRYQAIKNCPFTLYILLRFLAVICVLKVVTIVEFGKIKSNNLK